MSLGHPILNAYCVTEGPFARLEVPYFEHMYQPHCLLRGFESDEKLMALRIALKPETLSEMLQLSEYNSLNLGLENGPHNAIPRSINGDFSLQTAPSGKMSTPYNLSTCARAFTKPVNRPCVLPPSHPARPNVVAMATGGPWKKIDRVLRQGGNEFDAQSISDGYTTNGRIGAQCFRFGNYGHRVRNAVL